MKRSIVLLGLVGATLGVASPALASKAPTKKQALRALPAQARAAAHEIAKAPWGYNEDTHKTYRLKGFTARVLVSEASCRVRRKEAYAVCDVDFLAFYLSKAGAPAGAAYCSTYITFEFAGRSRARLVADREAARDMFCGPGTPNSPEALKTAANNPQPPNYRFAGPARKVPVKAARRAMPAVAAALGPKLGRAPLWIDTDRILDIPPRSIPGYRAQLFIDHVECDKPLRRTLASTSCSAHYDAQFVTGTGAPAGAGFCILFVEMSYDSWSRRPKLIRPYGASEEHCGPLPGSDLALLLGGQTAPSKLISAGIPTPPQPTKAPPRSASPTPPPAGGPSPPRRPHLQASRSEATASGGSEPEFRGCTWPWDGRTWGYNVWVAICTFYEGPNSDDFVGLRGSPSYYFYDYSWWNGNGWVYWTRVRQAPASGFDNADVNAFASSVTWGNGS